MDETTVKVGAEYLRRLEETVKAYRKEVTELSQLFTSLRHDSRCQLQLEIGDCDCFKKPLREIVIRLVCLADGGAK